MNEGADHLSLKLPGLNVVLVPRGYSASRIVAAVRAAQPTVKLAVLLVNSTSAPADFADSADEVTALPASESPEVQLSIADRIITRAEGIDRALVIDSLTDLAFLYNRIPVGGRLMVSGIDPPRLDPLIRLLSGSLNVLGILRRGDGSRMAEVVAEEFARLAGGALGWPG